MPPIGVAMGGVDFSNIFINLSDGEYANLAAAKEAGAATLNVGVFINTVIDFAIVAFAIFMMIKMMNRMKREEEAPAAEPTTKDCPHCLSTIPIKATRCGHCTSELTTA
jgi:large conductance mechanosensitive channel